MCVFFFSIYIYIYMIEYIIVCNINITHDRWGRERGKGQKKRSNVAYFLPLGLSLTFILFWFLPLLVL